ncbi:phosphomevalonate kinase [Streptococcus ruminantium]|uniref:phosphomevalonate kinase n=1 Tax=Streptococcus ruminantium TaxID=1917441 RepID=UPI0012DEA19E|nr:phosphomevalonate kinase [Streptococcus ruminantium]
MRAQVSVPGKLFLAGEYAVVEAGYPAIIAAVNQYLTVSVEEAMQGTIHSSQQPDVYLAWNRQDQKIHVQGDNPYQLITMAVQVTEAYLYTKGVACQGFYALDIQSELDNQSSGTKYGLGSSGAVTVATVKAILVYYGYRPDKLLVYKLAALTQAKLGMKGSFGDLAASSFGGLVAYHSLDRSWLFKKMAELSVVDLVELDWKDLSICPIYLPKELDLVVGWTGSAASTDHLISQMEDQKNQTEKEAIYSRFLVASKECVEQFIFACQTENQALVCQAITENRKLLREFSTSMGLVIETPKLSQLCNLAQAYGAVAKSSGAGGGDCGISLVNSQKQKAAIEEAWRQVGIFPLPLRISNEE